MQSLPKRKKRELIFVMLKTHIQKNYEKILFLFWSEIYHFSIFPLAV